MPEPRPGSPRNEAVACFAIAAAGIVVLGVTILRHELWRDELQAWQIARASDGFHSLVHNTRYEGHPILWFGLLYPLAHAHPGPGAMQLLQFFIAATTITVAAFRAPFSVLQKVLLVFGYFVLYEYGVLTRSYGLGAMLLVATLAIAATHERRRWPLTGALLGLIALTSAFGAAVAIAVLVGLVVDEQMRRRNETGTSAGTGSVLLGAALTLTGVVIAYIQAARTPGDTGSYNHWRTNLDVGLGASSVSAVWRALVPIPSLERAYWNTNILSARAAVVGVLGLVLLVGIAWLFRDRPGAFVVWVGGVALVVGFLYARIGTATASRHIGHIFLCLVAAMWLAPTMTRSRARSARQGTSPRSRSFPLTRSNAWTAMLVVQVIAGLFAVGLDLAYPFSNGRQVADFIRHKRLANLEIIGLPDTAASTVAGYLDRPIYYLAGARSGSFIVWDTARIRTQPLDQVIQTQPPFNGGPVLLLVNQPLDDPNLHLRLLTHFDDGIVRDEHFWLYLGTAHTSR